MHLIVRELYRQLYLLGVYLQHSTVYCGINVGICLGWFLEILIKTGCLDHIFTPAGGWTLLLLYLFTLLKVLMRGRYAWGRYDGPRWFAMSSEEHRDWYADYVHREFLRKRALCHWKVWRDAARLEGVKEVLAAEHRARRLLEESFEHWALRPGGVLFQRACTNFRDRDASPAC